MRPHLYLRGIPASGYAEKIRVLALAEEVHERVHILEPANPSEMERLAAAYDIGLSGEPSGTPNNAIALGNKLFSYLLAGIPMLLSDSLAHREFVKELGQAACLFDSDDCNDLAYSMDLWLDHPADLAEARKAAHLLGQNRFNWEIEQVKLIDVVDRTLGRPLSGVNPTLTLGTKN